MHIRISSQELFLRTSANCAFHFDPLYHAEPSRRSDPCYRIEGGRPEE